VWGIIITDLLEGRRCCNSMRATHVIAGRRPHLAYLRLERGGNSRSAIRSVDRGCCLQQITKVAGVGRRDLGLQLIRLI
jgi:hypothetical protein